MSHNDMSHKNKTEGQALHVQGVEIPFLIQTLLGPFGYLVEQEGEKLIFGGAKASRLSKFTGSVFIAVAILVYYFLIMRIEGWIWRILLSLVATAVLSVGVFFVRYYHAVILDQEKREIVVNTGGRKTRFAGFEEVKHFKNTEHRQRNHYRANSLSIVLKDERELRLISFKQSKLQEDFPTQINVLLWQWINGKQTMGSGQ